MSKEVIRFVVAFLLGTAFIYVSDHPIKNVIKCYAPYYRAPYYRAPYYLAPYYRAPYYRAPYYVNMVVCKNEGEQCHMYNDEKVKNTYNAFPELLI
jgi:hypothetical protein